MRSENTEGTSAGRPPGHGAGGRQDLFDRDFWEAITRDSPALRDDPHGAEHLVNRFLGKYLPNLISARAPEDRGRVWLAFWSYLIARASWKKPFGLSHEAADELIARFKIALGGGAPEDGK
jgi:hypothetical protein